MSQRSIMSLPLHLSCLLRKLRSMATFEILCKLYGQCSIRETWHARDKIPVKCRPREWQTPALQPSGYPALSWVACLALCWQAASQMLSLPATPREATAASVSRCAPPLSLNKPGIIATDPFMCPRLRLAKQRVFFHVFWSNMPARVFCAGEAWD